jgi:hypothetical protein
MSKLPRVNKKRKCQICGASDWCGISADGKFALCNRVSDGAVKVTSTNSFVHVLIEDDPKKPFVPRPQIVRAIPAKSIAPARTSDEHLNKVYSTFLGRLELANSHRDLLQKRTLNDIAICTHGYKSVPTPLFANKIAESLSKELDLRNVPGFYYQESWKFRTYGISGFFIPIKNSKSQTIGLNIRTDAGQKWGNGEIPAKYLLVSSAGKKYGASPGAIPHYAVTGEPFIKNIKPSHLIKEIIITEGHLKSNVASEYLDCPVIGLSGLYFEPTFIDDLTRIFPALKEAAVIFDKEIEGTKAFNAVESAKENLRLTLAKINVEYVEPYQKAWHPGIKGLDDQLVYMAGKRLTV